MLTKNSFLLKASSFDSKILNIFFFFLLNLFKKYYLQTNLIFFKRKEKKVTLLKSAHVHKKAREQFQITKISFLIMFQVPKAKVIDFFSLVKLNTPKTIDIRFK
jgi:small subunit ribosomal protein S10